MSFIYKFTHDYPLIFNDLSHGPNVQIQHADGIESDSPVEGGTVILQPGDTVTLSEPLKNPWLIEVTPQPDKTPAKAAKAAKAPTTPSSTDPQSDATPAVEVPVPSTEPPAESAAVPTVTPDKE
jgi:hypothetical protein